jgi:hypothetical protein
MQTSYDFNPAAARAGLLYDAAFGNDIVTRQNASALTPFGRFLVKDTGEGAVKLPSAAFNILTSQIEGVAVYSAFTQSGLAGDGVVPGIEAGKPINVLRKGRIWVYCETAFTPGTDTLYVRFTANGSTGLVGQVRNDADSGKADELGASGYGVAFEALNILTGAGFLCLDLNIPSSTR